MPDCFGCGLYSVPCDRREDNFDFREVDGFYIRLLYYTALDETIVLYHNTLHYAILVKKKKSPIIFMVKKKKERKKKADR